MTLLIDADWLLYVACAASEQDIRWTEDVHTLHSEPLAVQAFIQGKLNQWKKLTGHNDLIMCLSDYPGFRAGLFPEYKQNRFGRRKPLALAASRKALINAYPSKVITSLEGDDVMGLLMTDGTIDDPIMVAIDKDMRTIPGKLLVNSELVCTTELEANLNWMKQTLTGDNADNYPGIKGCGPKTAAKILEGAKGLAEMWAAVLRAYAKAGLQFNQAVLNARLARILRDGDYNYHDNAVRLWEPSIDKEIRTHG
jgi:DNA polymerase-1